MSKASTDHSQKQIQNYFNQTEKGLTEEIIKSFIVVLEMCDNATESVLPKIKYKTTRLFSTLKNFVLGYECHDDYFQKYDYRYSDLYSDLTVIYFKSPKVFSEIILYFEKKAFELFDKKKLFSEIKQELSLIVTDWEKEELGEKEQFKEILIEEKLKIDVSMPESGGKTSKEDTEYAPTNLRIKDMFQLEEIEERIVELLINQSKTDRSVLDNISEVFDNCFQLQESKEVLNWLDKTLIVVNKKEMVKSFKDISGFGITFVLAMMNELKEVCVSLRDIGNQRKTPIEILEMSRKKIKEELHNLNDIPFGIDFENEVESQEKELKEKKEQNEKKLKEIENKKIEIETFGTKCLETDNELIKAQRIAIPFEKWFNGDTHQVVIYLNEKKRITFNIQVNSTIPNGYLYQVNDKIRLRLNFVHPFYRRKGNDVIYYLKKNEINMGFKQSVRTPGGPYVKFDPSSFQKENNYELSFEGFGFKDKNEIGRFIIKLIDDNEPIPQPQDELTEMRMKDKLKFENLQKQLGVLIDQRHFLEKEMDQLTSSLEETKKRKEEHEKIIRQKEERKKIFVQYMSEWSGIEGIILMARNEHIIKEKTINEEEAINTKFRYSPTYSCPTQGKLVFVNAEKNKTINVGKLIDTKNNYSEMRKDTSVFWSSKFETYCVLKKENYPKKDGNDFIGMYQLLKEYPRIQIINIYLPSNYNECNYYPLIIGNSSQFNMDKYGTEIILPITLPQVYNAVYQSIFVNGYESKVVGLIIVNIQRTQTNTRSRNEPTYHNGQPPSYQQLNDPSHYNGQPPSYQQSNTCNLTNTYALWSK